jgi:hypothetical protein
MELIPANASFEIAPVHHAFGRFAQRVSAEAHLSCATCVQVIPGKWGLMREVRGTETA